MAARDPDLAAKCILYCFSAGMVAVHTAGNMLAPPPSLSNIIQSVRGAHEHDPRLCPKVYSVLFLGRDGGGGRIGLAAHAPNLEAECVLVLFFNRDCGGGAWGRHGSWLAPGRLGEGVFINREQ